MNDMLGRVVAVSGSQIRAEVTADRFAESSVRIGSMIKVRSSNLDVVGTISAAELDSAARIVLIRISGNFWKRVCLRSQAT
jgi:hypothetical protein